MMSEPEWRSHDSAFKKPSNTFYEGVTDIRMPSDIYIAPTSFSNMPSGTMSAGNNSPCKKTSVSGLCYNDQLYSQQQLASSSSSHLGNLQQAIFNRFGCGHGKKSSAPKTTSTLTKRTASIPSRNTSTTKSDDNMISMIDYTEATSSSSATSSGIEYKRRHRCTLPSITTTITDTTASDYSIGNSVENRQNAIDYHLLYANAIRRQENEDAGESQNTGQYVLSTRGLSRKGRASSQKQRCHIRNSKADDCEKHISVRRVASFTFSPEGSTQHKRYEPSVTTVTRKFTLGPLAKTFSYLRNKVDTAISSSSLYVTHEECKLWQESFEALLIHKYGCLLFRQFLKQEFSTENLEFWLDCEEFKKMKDGRKATVQKAHSIYNIFIKDGAEKEVNLDSTTKAATKAAIESGIRPDTFNLAQAKIEQLMSKDSYQRFLKSELYLEILNSTERQLTEPSVCDLDISVTTDKLLRTGSTRDASNRKVNGSARRHTCVPEQSETLLMHEIANRANQRKLLEDTSDINKLSQRKEV